MNIYVVDGSNLVRNLVNNRVSDRVSIVFSPHETRSGHGAENEQTVPRRGERKINK